MFEQTNQTTQEAELCSESDAEKAFIEGASQTDAQRDSGEKEEKYTVKYNGREVELSLDELKTNAQKGLNYDHVKEELDKERNSERTRMIRDIAKRVDMSPEDLLKKLQSDMERRELGELTENGMNEKEAIELMSFRRNVDPEVQRQVNDFRRNYPNVRPQDIPPEVLGMVRSGMSLTMAYAKKENDDLRAQLKMYEQNEKNAGTSVGSALSDGMGGQADPFLAGMMGY